MRLRDYLHFFRRSAIVILIFTVMGVAVGMTWGLLQPATYDATAKAFVSTGSASSVTDLNQGTTFTQQAVKSYADVATTPYVLNTVIRELHLHESASSLEERVTAAAGLDTTVLEITATDHSPTRAAAIANAVTLRLATAVAELTDSTSASAAVKITQLQSAEPPASPSSPKIVLTGLLSLLAGAIIGTAVGAIRMALDTRVRTVGDITQVTDFPVIGVVGYDAEAKSHPLVVADAGRTPRAEAFRTLRTNLQFVDFESDTLAVTVTSSIASEGKSTSAANLAIAMADAGRNVVIVDADMRRPKLGNYFGIDDSVGLTDTLIGSCSLDDALQVWGQKQLHILPVGQVPPNPSELLQSDSMLNVLAELRARFDAIIFDAPPLLPVSDAAILSRNTDGAILVCGATRVRRQELRSSIAALSQVDAKVLGMVLTMAPLKGPDAYYGQYGYGGYYGVASEASA